MAMPTETLMGTNLTEITPMDEMKLIPGLDLAPSCRMAWLSEEARRVWAPIIPKVSSLVSELEVLSVAKGQRPCAWQTIGEDQFPRLAAEWAEMGLVSLPIKRVRNFTGFAHRHEEPVDGERASLCVIVSKTLADTLRFKTAFEKGDNDAQGELLGFPKCCREFFCATWAKGYFDPIWQAALNSKHTTVGERYIRVEGHPFANPILRYAGLRVGFHIPHALDCPETIIVATERMKLAKANDPNLTKLLGALLSMPMSWDVYHGVAVVRTPIFDLIVPSVPAAERHVVELVSDPPFMPRESVRGIGFPFEEDAHERCLAQ
jgi:hypothetical protein